MKGTSTTITNYGNPSRTYINRSMTTNENYAIRQNGKIILKGDEISITMVFNNMTGKNIKDKKEYNLYKKFVESEGFSLDIPFELLKANTYMMTGNFKH